MEENLENVHVLSDGLEEKYEVNPRKASNVIVGIASWNSLHWA
jgi:hypothetical protein